VASLGRAAKGLTCSRGLAYVGVQLQVLGPGTFLTSNGRQGRKPTS